jgi:hypothetical protein
MNEVVGAPVAISGESDSQLDYLKSSKLTMAVGSNICKDAQNLVAMNAGVKENYEGK